MGKARVLCMFGINCYVKCRGILKQESHLNLTWKYYGICPKLRSRFCFFYVQGSKVGHGLLSMWEPMWSVCLSSGLFYHCRRWGLLWGPPVEKELFLSGQCANANRKMYTLSLVCQHRLIVTDRERFTQTQSDLCFGNTFYAQVWVGAERGGGRWGKKALD